MPIYEYRCTKNGHRFEVIQKVDDPPPTKCRLCSSPVEKLISRSSFILKGSGFYKNDYAPKRSAAGEKEGGAKEGNAKESKEGKEEKPTNAAKSSGTGDKKAAASS